MRRVLAILMVAVIVLPLSTHASEKDFTTGQVVVVDVASVAIRYLPKSSAAVVATVSRGDELTILSLQTVEAEGSVWWNIHSPEDDASGWLPDSAFSKQGATQDSSQSEHISPCWSEDQFVEVDGYPTWTDPPAMVIDPEQEYVATISTTKGEIVVELDAEHAPITANNFFCLATAGYYDGTDFHRISEDFLIQGGDPTGTGTGTPGYAVPSDPTTGSYPEGSIALANREPDENGAQFFISAADLTGQIPNDYPVFGQVVVGMDVVDEISRAPVEPNTRGELSRPQDPTTITKIEVETVEDEVGPPLPTQPLVPTPAPTPPIAPTVGLPPTTTAPIELDAKDIAFEPTTITIDLSDLPITIRMSNTGAALHNFTIDALNIDVDVNPGETVTVVIPRGTAPGTYDFYCKVPGHKEAGMVGTLEVVTDESQAAPTEVASGGCAGFTFYQRAFETATYSAFASNPDATSLIGSFDDAGEAAYSLTPDEYVAVSDLFSDRAKELDSVNPPGYARAWHRIQVDSMEMFARLYEEASRVGPFAADLAFSGEYLQLEAESSAFFEQADTCAAFIDWARDLSMV